VNLALKRQCSEKTTLLRKMSEVKVDPNEFKTGFKTPLIHSVFEKMPLFD
jgi:hypothetical protein